MSGKQFDHALAGCDVTTRLLHSNRETRHHLDTAATGDAATAPSSAESKQQNPEFDFSLYKGMYTFYFNT